MVLKFKYKKNKLFKGRFSELNELKNYIRYIELEEWCLNLIYQIWAIQLEEEYFFKIKFCANLLIAQF